jgi:hypothetical protein
VKYQEASKEREEMQRQLSRLKDQQEIIKMKNSSLGDNASNKDQQGYQFVHLLLVGLAALVIGAFIK